MRLIADDDMERLNTVHRTLERLVSGVTIPKAEALKARRLLLEVAANINHLGQEVPYPQPKIAKAPR